MSGNNSLAIVVPSRSRPRAVRELAAEFEATCTSNNTTLVVAVDDDDPDLAQYFFEHNELQTYDLMVGKRLRIGGTLNAVVPQYAQHYDAVGFMGDDHRPRTIGWDSKYLQALDTVGTGIVYGNDLLQGAYLPTQVAMTSDIILATGYFVPPGMTHLWLDNAWKSLGEALGTLVYLPDVIVEHLHPSVGKSDWDESYRENNADALFQADRLRYLDWLDTSLSLWVDQIRGYTRGGI